MKKALEKEIADFILWLTPCGQVEPCPSPKVIGREARRLYRKIAAHRCSSEKPIPFIGFL